MKELLLSSIIPYWLLFLLVLSSTGISIACTALIKRFPKLSGNILIILVTVICFLTVAGEWYIYLTVKNGCLWWCLTKDFNFFERLIRSIPLFVFLLCQIWQVVTYRNFIEIMVGKTGLQVKSTIVSVVILIPAMIFLYMFLDLCGLSTSIRNLIFYVCLVVGIILCLSKSFYKNISVAGFLPGSIFTVTSIIIVSGSFISVILLINVFLQLFFQFLVFAVGLAICNSVFPALSGAMAVSAPKFSTRFRDDAGHLHQNSGEMDAANTRIRASKSE